MLVTYHDALGKRLKKTIKRNVALKMIAITSPGDFKKQHKAILLQAAVMHWKQ